MASESKPGAALGDHLRNFRNDLPAGLVVFLVALPLCLGIALASGAPPLADIVTGIVGGMLVAWVSGSHTAVTGPAAGLIVVVLAGIESLGYRGFVLATSIAGVMQIGFGLARLGGISRSFRQQLPKALGWPGSVDLGDLASLLGQVHPGR
jgi:MFS superfamily sulfate permease-like transporter